jgi:hypothetical protein
LLVADVVANKFLAATFHLSLFLLAEALNGNVIITLIAGSLMALVLALVFHAVE